MSRFFTHSGFSLHSFSIKILRHHQLLFVNIFISAVFYLINFFYSATINKKTCPFEEQVHVAISLKNTNMAINSSLQVRRPHHGSHIVFIFLIIT